MALLHPSRASIYEIHDNHNTAISLPLFLRMKQAEKLTVGPQPFAHPSMMTTFPSPNTPLYPPHI